MKPLAEKLAERKDERLKKLKSPRTLSRKPGRPKGRKNNSTIIKETAQEIAAEVFANEIEKMKETAERVVKHAIYTNIHPIVEKMAQQAISGEFQQQNAFLKRVSPETKAVEPELQGGNIQININVDEFKRDE